MMVQSNTFGGDGWTNSRDSQSRKDIYQRRFEWNMKKYSIDFKRIHGGYSLEIEIRKKIPFGVCNCILPSTS